MEIYINLRRSIALARQLVKEYDETHDANILTHLSIVKQGIEELITQLENFSITSG